MQMISTKEKYLDHEGAILEQDNLLKKVETLAVCRTDHNGNFEDVNDAYCELYGYTREELIGKNFTLVLPEEARTAVQAIHDSFIKGAVEMPQEWTVVNKEGEEMHIRTEAVRILQEGKPPAKMTIIERLG